MKVKEAKEIVASMGLSAEAVAKIDEILSDFGEEDLSNEAIDKILKIVDIEMDATKLAADIYSAGAQMTKEFVEKIDDEAGKIADEIDEELAKEKTGQ